MRKHGLGKMPSWQRWFTISNLSICSVTGIVFLAGHEFQLARSVLGEHQILVIHGVTSALTFMAIGTVLPFHIKAGLKAKKNLISGISQLVFLTILVGTAMLLYYGPEELHDGAVWIHWTVGIIFFGIFIFHIINRSHNH